VKMPFFHLKSNGKAKLSD